MGRSKRKREEKDDDVDVFRDYVDPVSKALFYGAVGYGLYKTYQTGEEAGRQIKAVRHKAANAYHLLTNPEILVEQGMQLVFQHSRRIRQAAEVLTEQPLLQILDHVTPPIVQHNALHKYQEAVLHHFFSPLIQFGGSALIGNDENYNFLN